MASDQIALVTLSSTYLELENPDRPLAHHHYVIVVVGLLSGPHSFLHPKADQ